MNELRYQLDLLKAMNQKLSAREKVYRTICETSSNAYIYYSFENHELITLGQWKLFFSFEINNMKELTRLSDAVDEDGAILLREALFPEKAGETVRELVCMDADRKRWLYFCITVIVDDNGEATDKIILISDASKEKKREERLAQMAYYDGMTGLYSRDGFREKLDTLVTKAVEQNDIVSTMLIRINNYFAIRDKHGIEAGEDLQGQFAEFLLEFCGDNVIAGHMDGDTYAMAISRPKGMQSAENVYKAMQRRAEDFFYIHGGQAVRISISLGVAELPESADTARELIHCVQMALSHCGDKHSFALYDIMMAQEELKKFEMGNRLRDALYNHQFLVYYQPQFHTGNKRLRGLEAMVRWQISEKEIRSADSFLPIARGNGLIIGIGNWVVEQSIIQYAKWRAKYGIRFIMSINISDLQFYKSDFIHMLMGWLKQYDVNPAEIELELTENVLRQDFIAAGEKIKLLRDYGVRIAIDNFGAGNASVNTLKELPPDTLKLDKSLIHTMLTDTAARAVTEGVINMAKAFGIELIAQGVEEPAQYEYLHAVHCDMIQGYLTGEPQTMDATEELLQKML